MNNVELDNIIADQETGAGLLGRIHTFLGRFVRFPSDEAHLAVALWVLHAHLVEKCESTPRLAFLSAEPASGKTRALEIIELMVPRPISPVNASPAYLFTCVADEAGLPTVLFDEIDTVFGPKAKESNEDVRGFLNAGHRKGSVFGRCIYLGNGKRQREELPAYCAVALAGLGWLPDTILTRSVVIRMRPRHAGETLEPYRRRKVAPHGGALRRQVERWAATIESIDEPAMPPEIQDRDADVWEPLIAIADLAGGTWPERARKAAKALVAEAQEREASLGVRLLADIQSIFEGDHLASKAMLVRLVELEEAPWSDLKGRPLNERGLAHRLRQYGIKSKTVRIGDMTPKGYAKADFHDAWRRYLPDTDTHPPEKAPQAPQAPQGKHPPQIPQTAEKKLNGNNDVADVAEFADGMCAAGDVADNGVNVADSRPPQAPNCAQCRREPLDGKERLVAVGNEQVWLHQECERFYRRDHSGDLEIPASLDRRGELQRGHS